MKKKVLIVAAVLLPVILIGGILVMVEKNYQESKNAPKYSIEDVPPELIEEAKKVLGENVYIKEITDDGRVLFTGDPVTITSEDLKESTELSNEEIMSREEIDKILAEQVEKAEALATPEPTATPVPATQTESDELATSLEETFDYTEENYQEPSSPATPKITQEQLEALQNMGMVIGNPYEGQALPTTKPYDVNDYDDTWKGVEFEIY